MSLKGEHELYIELLDLENENIKLKLENERHRKAQVANKKKKIISIIICTIFLLAVVSGAVLYHRNAIEDAYDEGYSEGHAVGFEFYKEIKDECEKIKDEYSFFHKYAVITTTTGKKYHKYGCYHIEDRTFYIFNIAAAKAKGYTPCLDCFD